MEEDFLRQPHKKSDDLETEKFGRNEAKLRSGERSEVVKFLLADRAYEPKAEWARQGAKRRRVFSALRS